MSADEKWTTGDTVAALLTVPLGLAGSAIRGWAVSTLWSWFVVPLGFPAVDIVHAFGLGILASLLVARLDLQREKPNGSLLERTLTSAGQGALLSMLSVGMGWLARWFA